MLYLIAVSELFAWDSYLGCAGFTPHLVYVLWVEESLAIYSFFSFDKEKLGPVVTQLLLFALVEPGTC